MVKWDRYLVVNVKATDYDLWGMNVWDYAKLGVVLHCPVE
jgi:hypothetical protein